MLIVLQVRLSVVETYCERIRDLLDPSRDNLQVRAWLALQGPEQLQLSTQQAQHAARVYSKRALLLWATGRGDAHAYVHVCMRMCDQLPLHVMLPHAAAFTGSCCADMRLSCVMGIVNRSCKAPQEQYLWTVRMSCC
eukprot:GHRQ01032560.1.p1 GENE.GHRQ01032560.1~~GHRQ01032560.1.p1  ORF type:complete len:137 (+),score=16.71 GHRQ01032560.1:540-950(+)